MVTTKTPSSFADDVRGIFRYGNEDKLASLYGVMQALVSFVQHQDDCLQSIRAGDTNIVFLCKNHLILVAVSRTNENTSQLTNQLT